MQKNERSTAFRRALALGCWSLDCGGGGIDGGDKGRKRIRPRRAVASREERDHQMVAVSKDFGRNIDFVPVRHSQLDNATLAIGRVSDEELKRRGIGHLRRLPDRVPDVYRAERQFGAVTPTPDHPP